MCHGHRGRWNDKTQSGRSNRHIDKGQGLTLTHAYRMTVRYCPNQASKSQASALHFAHWASDSETLNANTDHTRAYTTKRYRLRHSGMPYRN